MKYSIKSDILGFDNIKQMELGKIDDLFYTLKSTGDENISFTLVSPYQLREYSFDLPNSVKTELDINESSNVAVYNIVVLQEPLDESVVNFRAPLVFNEDNGLMAQAVLTDDGRSEYSCTPIKAFKS